MQISVRSVNNLKGVIPLYEEDSQQEISNDRLMRKELFSYGIAPQRMIASAHLGSAGA